jgi:hypothetical protein
MYVFRYWASSSIYLLSICLFVSLSADVSACLSDWGMSTSLSLRWQASPSFIVNRLNHGIKFNSSDLFRRSLAAFPCFCAAICNNARRTCSGSPRPATESTGSISLASKWDAKIVPCYCNAVVSTGSAVISKLSCVLYLSHLNHKTLSWILVKYFSTFLCALIVQLIQIVFTYFVSCVWRLNHEWVTAS